MGLYVARTVVNPHVPFSEVSGFKKKSGNVNACTASVAGLAAQCKHVERY